MLQYIANQVRNAAITDAALYEKIATRFYPNRTDLTEIPTFPAITFAFLGGVVDAQNYPADVYLFECSYISTSSLDQSIEIYDLFHGIINTENFRDDSAGQYFQIFEDSKPIDGTDEYGGVLLYLVTNTWSVKAVG